MNETHDGENTEKERGRSKGKNKEKDRMDYLAEARTLNFKRAQLDSPVMNNGPSPRKARNEKNRE